MDYRDEWRATTLGALLKILRMARGRTQMELSSSLSGIRGMSQPAISRIEKDQMMPTAGALEALLRELAAPEADCRRARQLALDALRAEVSV